jgi:hypothetical protein
MDVCKGGMELGCKDHTILRIGLQGSKCSNLAQINVP